MCSITFGKRFEYTDKRFLTLLDLIAKYFTIGSQQKGLVGFFPWMRVLPGIRFGMHFIVVYDSSLKSLRHIVQHLPYTV